MKTKRQSIQTKLSIAGVILSIVLLVISTALAEEKIINPTLAVIFIITSVILVGGSICFAAKVDYETSVYVCRKCGHTFKPSPKAYVWGAHTLTTRHLKCPECNEKSWCTRKNAKV